MQNMQLRGVMPPMITPFCQNGDVDYDAFCSNLDRWNQADLSGYLVLGSNSETCFLDEAEKLELIRLTAQVAHKDRLLLCGTGMESVRDTVRLTNQAARLGMQAALILTPFYYIGAMNSAALINFFTQVADQTDIPILIYNVPKFTHNNIGADAVAALCRHPNIIGMKDSQGDVPQLVKFIDAIGDADFTLLTGTASVWYPALTLGLDTAIQALANCCPNETAQVQHLYDAGKYAEANALYQRLFHINAAVTATFGIAGLKYVCTKLGYRGGFVRAPLLELSAAQKQAIDGILKKAGY